MRRHGTSLMVGSAACFTINVLLVRALGQLYSANVWVVSCSRFVLGLILIRALFWRDFQPSHLWRNRKLIERGVCGGLGIYLSYLCAVEIGAGRSKFISSTYVIWAAFLAAWVLRERLHIRTIASGIAALIGLGLLTNVFIRTSSPGLYDLLAVLGSLLSAWVVVTIRQLHATENTITIIGALCVYGLLLCIVPGVLTWRPMPREAWVLIVLAGVIVNVGQLAMTRAYRDLPVAEGVLLQMTEPLGVMFGGIVLYGEHFTQHELVGAAIILASTTYAALRRHTPDKPKVG